MISVMEGARAIRNGQVVVYPTESFYALGADATNRSAVRTLFQLKRRDRKNPVALLAGDERDVRRFFSLDRSTRQLARQHWPGALTVVVRPKKPIAARSLGSPRTGVRIPAHELTRRLASIAGVPITATSANIAGHRPTKSAAVVRRVFPTLPIVAGRCGRARKPSTVVEVRNGTVRVIRPGAIFFRP